MKTLKHLLAVVLVVAMVATVAFAASAPAAPTNVVLGIDEDISQSMLTVSWDWDDSWDYNINLYRQEEDSSQMLPYFGISASEDVWLELPIDRYPLLNDQWPLEDGVYSFTDTAYGISFSAEDENGEELESDIVTIPTTITYNITPQDTVLQATSIGDKAYTLSGMPADTTTMFSVNIVETDEYGTGAYFTYSDTQDTDNQGNLTWYLWEDLFGDETVCYLDVYTTTLQDDGSYMVDVDLYEVELLDDGEAPTVTEPAPVEEEEEFPVISLANPTDSTVLVNGENTAFGAYNINDNNYFMLRDIAMVVNGTDKQFEVLWDGELNAINLISGESYSPVDTELAAGDGVSKEYIPTSSTVYVDGVEADFEAYTIDGSNYFKLRDVCSTFDIGVTWDGATETIGIDTSIGYTD